MAEKNTTRRMTNPEFAEERANETGTNIDRGKHLS